LGMTGTRVIIAVIQFISILLILYLAYADGILTDFLVVVGFVALIVTGFYITKRYKEHSHYG